MNILDKTPLAVLQVVYTIMDIMDKESISKNDLAKHLATQEMRTSSKSTGTKSSSIGGKLEKPCCGGGKTDAAVKAFKEKQRRLREERRKR